MYLLDMNTDTIHFIYFSNKYKNSFGSIVKIRYYSEKNTMAVKYKCDVDRQLTIHPVQRTGRPGLSLSEETDICG